MVAKVKRILNVDTKVSVALVNVYHPTDQAVAVYACEVCITCNAIR